MIGNKKWSPASQEPFWRFQRLNPIIGRRFAKYWKGQPYLTVIRLSKNPSWSLPQLHDGNKKWSPAYLGDLSVKVSSWLNPIIMKKVLQNDWKGQPYLTVIRLSKNPSKAWDQLHDGNNEAGPQLPMDLSEGSRDSIQSLEEWFA